MDWAKFFTKSFGHPGCMTRHFFWFLDPNEKSVCLAIANQVEDWFSFESFVSTNKLEKTFKNRPHCEQGCHAR
jgi:hypothetical protein